MVLLVRLEGRLLRECFEGKTTRRWLELPLALLDIQVGIPSHSWLPNRNLKQLSTVSTAADVEDMGRQAHADILTLRGQDYVRVFARSQWEKCSIGAYRLCDSDLAYLSNGIIKDRVRAPFKVPFIPSSLTLLLSLNCYLCLHFSFSFVGLTCKRSVNNSCMAELAHT